ncbi:hypothetical protein [Desulfurobacterium sp.]
MSEAKFIDKCRITHDGRKETSYYILEAPDRQAVEHWVKENVHYEPRILAVFRGEKHWVAEVEEWVD